MPYTNEDLELVAIEQDERQDIANRVAQTTSIRARIFKTHARTVRWAAKQGSQGTKKLCVSVNAIGDANQLYYINKMSVSQIAELLTKYETLIQTNGATLNGAPSSPVIGIMAHTLYQSYLLQQIGDDGFEDDILGSAPHKQAPRFGLIPNLTTGVLTVASPTE